MNEGASEREGRHMCGSSRNNSEGRKNSNGSANDSAAPTIAPTTGQTRMNEGARWVGIHMVALETTTRVERTTAAVPTKAPTTT